MVVNHIKGDNYYFEETRYKDKTQSAAGNEIQVEMRGWKKINEWIKYWIYVNFHLWDSSEVEVEQNGVKKKLWRGRILVSLKADVEYDWMKKFTGTKFNEFLGKVYLSLNKKSLESVYGDGLYYDAMKLHQKIKEVLGLTAESTTYYARM